MTSASRAFLTVGAGCFAVANAAAQAQPGIASNAEPPSALVVLEFATPEPAGSGQDGGASANQPDQSSGTTDQTGSRDGASDGSGDVGRSRQAATDRVSVPALIARADAQPLARLVLREVPDEPTSVDGVLVFEDAGALRAWREEQMASFFEPMGGAEALETTIRLVDRALLERYGLGGPDVPLENVAISYTNADNAADGDADIDAVTVICPGDFSDCKPSN